MGITHVATTSAAGTTSAVPTYPAGMVDGDTLYMGVGACHDTVTFPEIAGWAKLFDLALGGGSVGAGTGPRRVGLYRKHNVFGTESGTVTVTPVGGSDVCFAAMTAWRCVSGSMIQALYQTGQDTTAGTAIVATAGSVLGETANDVMLGWVVAPASANLTGQLFTATNATYGVAVEQVDAGSASGDDIEGSFVSQPVSTGTATAATVYNSTATTTAGAIFIRLREVASAALALSVLESTNWTATTTPQAVAVASCLDGDWLFVLAGGDDFEPTNDTTAASVSTTAGTTLPWREIAKILTGTSADWLLAGVTQVSVAGSVTVSVGRTMSGTPGPWGYYVVRARNCAGLGNFATDFASGAEKIVNLAVTQDSAVGFLSCDFDAGTVGTAWVPAAAAVLVERAVEGAYTAHAAYWPDEDAGTRDYGSSGGGGAHFRCMAVEMLTAATIPPPPPEGPMNSTGMHLMGKAGW